MDTAAKPAYRAVTAARRQTLTAGQGGFKWALWLAIATIIAVLLLEQQQTRHCAGVIHMRHPDDNQPEHDYGL